MTKPPTNTWISRAHDVALALLFFGALLTPGVAWIVTPANEEAAAENRKLAAWPAAPETLSAIPAYPRAFEAWYNDHFGFRGPLIQAHNRVKFDVLRVSPSPKVIVGQDGWLYSATDHADDYALAAPPTEAQLQQFTEKLEARRKMLAKRGIKFLFVIAPNKRTIYPEFLPVGQPANRGESPLDHLFAYLAEHSEVEALDLRPLLVAGKESGLTYLQTDTHWNARGSVIATNAIMERIGNWFEGATSRPISEYTPSEKNRSGDLARMLGMTDHIREMYPVLSIPETEAKKIRGPVEYPGYAARNKKLRENRRYIKWGNPDASLTALMARDSFGDALGEYMAEHFRQLVLTPPNKIEPHLLDAVKPDVVILECVERYLHAPNWLYDNP